MTVALEIVVWPLLGWWVISPFVSWWIGWRRGHPVIGWLLGLAPLIGPFLALRLPDDRDR